jgi:hypothetical protein
MQLRKRRVEYKKRVLQKKPRKEERPRRCFACSKEVKSFFNREDVLQ